MTVLAIVFLFASMHSSHATKFSEPTVDYNYKNALSWPAWSGIDILKQEKGVWQWV